MQGGRQRVVQVDDIELLAIEDCLDLLEGEGLARARAEEGLAGGPGVLGLQEQYGVTYAQNWIYRGEERAYCGPASSVGAYGKAGPLAAEVADLSGELPFKQAAGQAIETASARPRVPGLQESVCRTGERRGLSSG